MTTDIPTPAELARMTEDIQAAKDEVCGLADGTRKWRMCVPVDQHDSDSRLMTALLDADRLLAAVEALTKDARRHAMTATPSEAMRYDIAALRAQVEALQSRLTEETQRADRNFASYERIKKKYIAACEQIPARGADA
jgi:hypothetical protein